MGKVEVYDTTLRDGCQAEGISFGVGDKLRILRRLDELGVDYVEGGWPNPTSPLDSEFFDAAQRVELQHARLAAFGSTCRPDRTPAEDEQLGHLLRSEAPVLTIFGKSWDFHVDEVLRCSRERNLEMIRESVAFLRAAGREVFFDAEHYFDGLAANPEYALATLQAAAEGGAQRIVLCDTNGGALQPWVAEGVRAAQRAVSTPLAIHVHNDAGLAVANSLSAVELGCVQVQGTINGYGERTGNADLCVVVPNLVLKMGCECLAAGGLPGLRLLSREVADWALAPLDERQPYMGSLAFAHKGGMHVNAVLKDPRSFEHVPPEAVGNERRLLVSDQAGSSAVQARVAQYYPDVQRDGPLVQRVLATLKRREHEGYAYEGADASLELLVREAAGDRHKLFDLIRMTVLVKEVGREVEEVYAEAALQLAVDGHPLSGVADGDGPVHALDNALRQALNGRYPKLDGIRLTDFVVRIVSTGDGTSATVRVVIESTDHRRRWKTVGAHTNLIWAAWRALVDSYEYGLFWAENG